jgi:endonuclease/exonuclease/phosphatase family metal-dependent hydrolase
MKSFASKVKYLFKGLRYVPILNKQANAIISKYELEDIKYHKMRAGIKRIIIQASVELDKKTTLLLAYLPITKKARKKQIIELVSIINKIKGPVILA